MALQPIIDAQVPAITARVRQSSTPATFSRNVQREIRKTRRDLHRRHRVNLLSILALPALKLPLWISLSLTLRSMAGTSIPYLTPLDVEPLFQTEGVAWVQDLTVPDSLILLPFLFGMLNLVNVEVNAARGLKAGRLRIVIERVMRVVSVAFIPVAAQMPAAVCLYWTSSAAITLCQNIWLNRQYPVVTQPQSQDRDVKVKERLELPGIDTILTVNAPVDLSDTRKDGKVDNKDDKIE